MANPRIRRNVFASSGDWPDEILWYARAVKAMKARRLADRTSWRFFAAIHGIEGFRWVWDYYGITDGKEPDPNPNDKATFIDQCQHQTWYFLPWHRGYLLAIENVLRHEIGLLRGPAETWALPYWNYFAEGQNVLPPAFRSKIWPDGPDDNPLYAEQRWGELSGATPFDVRGVTDLKAMNDPDFSGPGGGGQVGFGGPETGFNWGGGDDGELEINPHGVIHVLIGRRHPTDVFPDGTPGAGLPLIGLMSHPLSAALDPVFYLHHCNIDRLWEAWNKVSPGNTVKKPTDWRNPRDPKWLAGPSSSGERGFAMPNPDGSQWSYVPSDMEDIAALGYEYDDLSLGVLVQPRATMSARMASLRIVSAASTGAGAEMARQHRLEIFGASEGTIELSGSGIVNSLVKLEPKAQERLTMSLEGRAPSKTLPDRVFLKLDVTGLLDAVLFQVLVRPAVGNLASLPPALHVGSVSLFGLTQASGSSGRHGGGSKSFTFEITDLVDELHLAGQFDSDQLTVEFAPIGDVPATAKIRIEKISLYRQFE